MTSAATIENSKNNYSNSKRRTVNGTLAATTPTAAGVEDDKGNSSTTGGLGVAGLSPYGLGGMGMYGGPGAMMMGSPYSSIGMGMGMGMGSGSMMMGGMGGGGPLLNSLNQFLFGVQAVIYSLSSAVQVIGMNTHALQQLVEALQQMIDHAVTTFREMRTLEASSSANETEEQKLRRRRLKALRWAFVLTATYASYRLMRSIVTTRRNKKRHRQLLVAAPASTTATATAPLDFNQNHNHSNQYSTAAAAAAEGGYYSAASPAGYSPYPQYSNNYGSSVSPYGSMYSNGYGVSGGGYYY